MRFDRCSLLRLITTISVAGLLAGCGASKQYAKWFSLHEVPDPVTQTRVHKASVRYVDGSRQSIRRVSCASAVPDTTQTRVLFRTNGKTLGEKNRWWLLQRDGTRRELKGCKHPRISPTTTEIECLNFPRASATRCDDESNVVQSPTTLRHLQFDIDGSELSENIYPIDTDFISTCLSYTLRWAEWLGRIPVTKLETYRDGSTIAHSTTYYALHADGSVEILPEASGLMPVLMPTNAYGRACDAS